MPNATQIQTPKGTFDPQAFLGRAAVGRATEKYEKNKKIFSQADIAAAVFFIQKGKVQLL